MKKTNQLLEDLRIEQKELKKLCVKLDKFILSDDFINIDEFQMYMLVHQREYMAGYYDILTFRINRIINLMKKVNKNDIKTE